MFRTVLITNDHSNGGGGNRANNYYYYYDHHQHSSWSHPCVAFAIIDYFKPTRLWDKRAIAAYFKSRHEKTSCIIRTWPPYDVIIVPRTFCAVSAIAAPFFFRRVRVRYIPASPALRFATDYPSAEGAT